MLNKSDPAVPTRSPSKDSPPTPTPFSLVRNYDVNELKTWTWSEAEFRKGIAVLLAIIAGTFLFTCILIYFTT